MGKFNKKSQSAGAAASFLAIIAGFLLLYLLLIPPDLRQELLEGEGTTVNNNNNNKPITTPTIINSTLLSVTPGRVDYLKQSEYEHPLPSINLYTTTNAKEDLILDSVFIKNSIFDKKDGEATFNVNDVNNIDNVYFIFGLNKNRNNKGVISIYLNDNLILERELGSSGINEPIVFKKEFLRTQNILRFKVSGVGYKFWTTNEYELNNLKLFYDYTDTLNQESRITFNIEEAEKFNLQSAIFRFNADCNPRDVGVLRVRINNQNIFSSVPDCGGINQVVVSPHILEAGQNNVVFETMKGHYLIDQIMLKTTMRSMAYPIYNFYLEKSLFIIKKESTTNPQCGENDGICPENCEEYLDQDCCHQKTSKYWCPLMTSNINDRCRTVTSIDDCKICEAGYINSNGVVSTHCIGMCGDNFDGECPVGCDMNYDKDCCFLDSEENYWCKDVPKYGISHRCRRSLHVDDCFICESGWETKKGTFTCPSNVYNDFEDIYTIKRDYNVKLKMSFFNDNNRKAARIFVNGFMMFMDHTGSNYESNLNNYLEPGSNSIKIEPQVANLEIIKMEVVVEKK
jgi:hypothetical protein